MTKVRFQADADLNQAIVTGSIRRCPNLDFQSANTLNLEGVQDQDVLDITAREARILVTHDCKTIPTEFGQFILSKNSYGVLVIAQNLSIREAINSIILIWEVSTAEEWVNQIMTLPF